MNALDLVLSTAAFCLGFTVGGVKERHFRELLEGHSLKAKADLNQEQGGAKPSGGSTPDRDTPAVSTITIRANQAQNLVLDYTKIVSPLDYDRESLLHVVNSQNGVERLRTLTSLLRLIKSSGFGSAPKSKQIQSAFEEAFKLELNAGNEIGLYNLLIEAGSIEGTRFLGEYLAREADPKDVAKLIDEVAETDHMVQLASGFFESYFSKPEAGKSKDWIDWITTQFAPSLQESALSSIFLGYSSQGNLEEATLAAQAINPSTRTRQSLDGLLVTKAARIDPSFGLGYLRANSNLQNQATLYKNFFKVLQRENPTEVKRYLEQLTKDEKELVQDSNR